MSILDQGPHTVTVIPKTRVKNRLNTWELIPGEPVEMVGVSVQALGAAPTKPVSEAVQTGLGEQVRTNLRVLGRGPWPGGPYSEVIWEGRVYDQEGEAAVYSMSARTQHFSVVLTARSLVLH